MFSKEIKKVKTILKKIPVIYPLAKRIKKEYFSKPFPGSEKYWIQRYERGGNSGLGSYNKLAEFKAQILNDFVKRNNISTIIEYGCGDGSQLKLAVYSHYLEFDVSAKAISLCKTFFAEDSSKNFKLMENYNGERADLTISLDVAYHLIEDNVFESYMKTLFGSSDQFVIIYSSNTDEQENNAPHVRHRKFTTWVKENLVNWKLIQHIPNKYPYTGDLSKGSSADFDIYKKVCSVASACKCNQM